MAPEGAAGQPAPAWLLGVDFSCAPSARKPIVAAWGRRHGAVVKLEALESITTLHGFASLESAGSFQVDASVDDSFTWIVDFIDHGLRSLPGGGSVPPQ